MFAPRPVACRASRNAPAGDVVYRRAGSRLVGMGVQYSPRGHKKRRQRLVGEDREWAARNPAGTQITYVCICARNPVACQAAIHATPATPRRIETDPGPA